MALFKISKGSKNNLPATLTEGYCWYTFEDSKFYIDHKDADGTLVRKALNAQEAEKLSGASLATILNSSNIEIPTSKAVVDYVITQLSAIPTIYVSEDAPTNAAIGSLWIDTSAVSTTNAEEVSF